jgi:hypothetical protein
MSDDAVQERETAPVDVGAPPPDRAPVGQALEAPPAAGLEVWILIMGRLHDETEAIVAIYATREAAMRDIESGVFGPMEHGIGYSLSPMTVRE